MAALRKVVLFSFGPNEGCRWVRAALEAVDERTPVALHARLEHTEAQGAGLLMEREAALAAAERALARYREAGDVLGIAQMQQLAGGYLALLGRAAEAQPMLREALESARTLGDRRLVCLGLHKIGWALSNVGDFNGARAHFTEALHFAELVGDKSYWACVTSDLAENEFRIGDTEAALRLASDALATYRTMNCSMEPGMAFVLTSITAYLIALGRYDEARATANEALKLACNLSLIVLVAASLKHLALLALLQPQVNGRSSAAANACAARLLGFVDARCSTLSAEEPGLEHQYAKAFAILRDAMGPDNVTNLMAAGATMTDEEAIEQAHAFA